MSIQRYTNEPFGAFAPCENGDYVLYSDHLTDKQAALDAQQAAHAAEVERLTAERDAAVRERDAAVEILKDALSGFMLTQKGAKYPEWHWSVRARAALAKTGGRG